MRIGSKQLTYLLIGFINTQARDGVGLHECGDHMFINGAVAYIHLLHPLIVGKCLRGIGSFIQIHCTITRANLQTPSM
jgi:hypothetical protein